MDNSTIIYKINLNDNNYQLILVFK